MYAVFINRAFTWSGVSDAYCSGAQPNSERPKPAKPDGGVSGVAAGAGGATIGGMAQPWDHGCGKGGAYRNCKSAITGRWYEPASCPTWASVAPSPGEWKT